MTPTRLLLLCAALVTACASSEDETTGGSWAQVPPPSMGFPTGVQDTSVPTCGPAELCARSIDDCAVELDPATCEDWYAVGDCRDMDAYTTCNCDCEESEDTCDGYFACGQLCFLDHCEG